MTNPTSNFGWQMPTSTDLVTDLPADFETFGQAVDTSLADLKGGTTGQILSKASNTDMDFTWVANDVGDITAVTASSPLTGGGTSGAITIGIQDATTSVKGAVQLTNSTSSTSTTTAATPSSVKTAFDLANAAIAKSIVDAKGDLIAATGADTVSRLAVGTNNQVLIADSAAATGMRWATPATSASGLTLVKSQVIGSAVSSVNVTAAFSSTYDSYLILVTGGVTSADAQLSLKLGSTTTGYYAFSFYGSYTGGTLTGQNTNNGAAFPWCGIGTLQSISAQFHLQNPNVAKNTHYSASSAQSNTAGNPAWVQGFLNNTTQYTDFTLTPTGGATMTGGTIRVYGYQNS